MAVPPSIPPATREEVMTALFTIIQGLTTGISPMFKSASRKVKLWTEVPAEDQPAIFMMEKSEQNTQQHRGLPPNQKWMVDLIIYATIQDDEVGSITLNNLIDAVELIMPPDPSTNVFTIGKRVYRAWNDGEVKKDPGDLDGQALAVYPICISAP